MADPIIHHGVMFSYYSAKTRAYLSYKRLPFVEQYHARDLSGRIREITHKVMIPVVEMPDGQVLQDTTEIIDVLEARYPARPVIPTDPVLLLLTRIVEFIIDEFWIVTAMNTRWNDPVSNKFAATDFGLRIGGSMGLQGEEALAIGARVAAEMQSALPYLGISDEEGQKAAGEFFEEATLALNEVVSSTEFAFGSRLSLMDLCLFTGYYAHQYRDAGTAQQFLKTQTPRLCYYIDNINAGHCVPDSNSELSISDKLIHYLSVIGVPGAQFASGVLERCTEAAEHASKGEVFEQRLNPFTFELSGRPFSRGASTFSAWKAQRIHDVYRSLDTSSRERAQEIASQIGWSSFLQADPGYRLERKDYQIYLV